MHRITLFFLVCLLYSVSTFATTSISYQGQLQQSGVPFTGTADLVFLLFDQESGGTQVGSTIILNDWPVTDGLFQVELDFGAGVFGSETRYLEVWVDGSPMTPRQQVRPVPVAHFALDGNPGPEGPPAAIDLMHAGYDLNPDGFPDPMTTTTQTMWDPTSDLSYGGGPVTVESGQTVVASVSVNVYKNDPDTTEVLYVELEPCYSTSSDYSSPVGTPFQGSTRGRFRSTGSNDEVRMSASYHFVGLSGTYYFSLCMRRLNTLSTFADFSISAPKVSVLVIDK